MHFMEFYVNQDFDEKINLFYGESESSSATVKNWTWMEEIQCVVTEKDISEIEVKRFFHASECSKHPHFDERIKMKGFPNKFPLQV